MCHAPNLAARVMSRRCVFAVVARRLIRRSAFLVAAANFETDVAQDGVKPIRLIVQGPARNLPRPNVPQSVDSRHKSVTCTRWCDNRRTIVVVSREGY